MNGIKKSFVTLVVTLVLVTASVPSIAAAKKVSSDDNSWLSSATTSKIVAGVVIGVATVAGIWWKKRNKGNVNPAAAQQGPDAQGVAHGAAAAGAFAADHNDHQAAPGGDVDVGNDGDVGDDRHASSPSTLAVPAGSPAVVDEDEAVAQGDIEFWADAVNRETLHAALVELLEPTTPATSSQGTDDDEQDDAEEEDDMSLDDEASDDDLIVVDGGSIAPSLLKEMIEASRTPKAKTPRPKTPGVKTAAKTPLAQNAEAEQESGVEPPTSIDEAATRTVRRPPATARKTSKKLAQEEAERIMGGITTETRLRVRRVGQVVGPKQLNFDQ